MIVDENKDDQTLQNAKSNVMKAQFTDLPENDANVLFQPNAANAGEVAQIIEDINSNSTATNNEKHYNMDVDQKAMTA